MDSSNPHEAFRQWSNENKETLIQEIMKAMWVEGADAKRDVELAIVATIGFRPVSCYDLQRVGPDKFRKLYKREVKRLLKTWRENGQFPVSVVKKRSRAAA